MYALVTLWLAEKRHNLSMRVFRFIILDVYVWFDFDEKHTKAPYKGVLFFEGRKQVGPVLFCSQRWCTHTWWAEARKLIIPISPPSFLEVPIIIKPLKQIKARPNLFPFRSINQTRLLGQWSLKGSGVAWRVLRTVQPECSAWAVKCGKRHTRGVGSPPRNEGGESCCKHTRLAKDKNRAGEWFKKLDAEPQVGRGAGKILNLKCWLVSRGLFS